MHTIKPCLLDLYIEQTYESQNLEVKKPFFKNTFYWLFVTQQYINTYHIYLYKRPLPINCSPRFLTFAKFIFRGFTSLLTATSLAILGFQKKMRFSTTSAHYLPLPMDSRVDFSYL